MKLFIIPGGGDPEIQSFKEGFELIQSEAKKREFEDVFIFKFPGHFSVTGNQEFHNQKVSTSIVEERLLEVEKQNLPYSIFCRSYGCGIGMDILSKHTLPNLQRIVLWGPVPILEIYKVTVFNKSLIEKAKLDKGCYVNYETYQSCNPFEIQLLKYKGNHTIHIGAGSLDEYCKQPVFFNFLKEYIGEKENIKYHSIVGLRHSVAEYNQEYIDFVFGN